MNLLLQLLANGFVNGAVYGLLAAGFGLVYRSTRVFHLAYGGLYVLAGYVFYCSTVLLGLPFLFGVPLTLLVTAVFGSGIEKIVYSRFHRRGSHGGVILIASLGVYIVIENTLALIFGNETKILSTSSVTTHRIGAVNVTSLQLAELLVCALGIAVLWLGIRSFRVFKAIWAMGDEPDLLPILGIPLYRMRLLVFAISSMCVALPACLLSLDVGLEPQLGMNYFLVAAVSVIFGGTDRLEGWILGGLVVAELQGVAVWVLSARWADLITFLVLVLILLTRPQGLTSTRKRLEEV